MSNIFLLGGKKFLGGLHPLASPLVTGLLHSVVWQNCTCYKKIKQYFATRNDNFFQIETRLFGLFNEFKMQIMYFAVFEKKRNSIESLIYHFIYIQPFPVEVQKMSFSILIKARPHNLPWLILSHWGSGGMKGPVSLRWKIARSLQYILPSSAIFAKQFEECQNFRTR